jgi:hypothetical protein
MSGGWGTNWGGLPWGGFLLPSSEAPPSPALCPEGYDIYCYCEPGRMDTILVDPRIEVTHPDQFSISPSNDLCVISNGVAPTNANAFMRLNYAVTPSWTFRVDAIFGELPTDFVDVVASHIYFGSTNSTGIAAGLFVSAAGLAYSGSISLEGGLLHLGGSFQIIPGTAGSIETNKLYRFQIVVDGVTSTTYIFMAEPLSTTDYLTPLTLVAILPGTPNGGIAPDGTTISVVGTQKHPSAVCFSTLCLSSDIILQVPPPVSDAGKDQALRMCSLGQLDGTGSYDPEGGSIAYSWRLTDAPVGSSFAVEGSDGFTVSAPIPNGYTDKFYSSELGDAAAIDPVVTGDVLVLRMQTSAPGTSPVTYLAPASVRETGIDGLGYYIRLNDNVLKDDLIAVHFKLLRNRFLSGATTAKPTFFPDVPGIYKFDLVVFNGKYLGAPAYVIANVLESQVPKGCTPDLGFVWQYLSDFWKLVDDRERIQVFWEGMAQVVASELLTLWQADYSKSLRDIQRTFQRRWLHYDLKLPEPAPDLTSVRQMYGSIDAEGAFTAVQGTSLQIRSPVHDPITVEFPLANPYTAEVLQGILKRKLQWVDSRYNVIVFGSGSSVRITAPFLFQVGPATTFPYLAVGAMNLPAAGTSGTRLTPRTYLVEQSLQGLDIKPYDLLVIGGVAYRILRVVDDATDVLPYQRVIVESDLPLLPGSDWIIPSYVTSKLLNFYAGLLDVGDIATLEVINTAAGGLTLMAAPVLGACAADANKLAVDLTNVYQYLSLTGVTSQLAFVKRKVHIPVGPLVLDVPCLQEQIKEPDDGAVLRRNVDYFIETFRGQNTIRFAVGALTGDLGDVWEGRVPPDRMWAETTYLDNRPTVEANFGIPAEFTLDQLKELDADLDYLSAVQGLWYAYLNGPTLFNMRAGVQILLGLPFAEEEGVIEEIRADFSTVQGRLLLRDVANPAIVRAYTYPNALSLEVNPETKARYVVGDIVRQLSPMVEGSEVLDYVKDPRWFQGLLSQGNFLEVEKFHKFMVRVNSSVFSLSSLMFVMSFILRIKPTWTRPVFVVQKSMDVAEVNVVDTFTARGFLKLNAGVCFPNFGASQIFDDYSPAAYGVRNQFDADSDQSTAPPVFPTPDTNITWGFDKMYLCPEDIVVFWWIINHPGGVVQYDEGFAFDASNRLCYLFEDTSVTSIPSGPGGYTLPGSYTAQESGTLSMLKHTIQGTTPVSDYEYVVVLNGTDVDTIGVIIGLDGSVEKASPAPSIAITAGDVLTLRLRRTTGAAVTVDWPYIKVVLAQTPALAFTFDNGIAEGGYYFERTA